MKPPKKFLQHKYHQSYHQNLLRQRRLWRFINLLFVLIGYVFASAGFAQQHKEINKGADHTIEPPKTISSQPSSMLLGRLLTSSDERSRIDNMRLSKSQLGVDKKLTYHGVVKKQGSDWIWLGEQVLAAGADKSLILHADKSLSVVVDEKVYRLKPGQTLVPSLGKIEDPLDGATVKTWRITQ